MNTNDLSLSFTVLRQVLQVGGGALATKGIVDSETANALAGGLAALLSVIWGLIVSHRKNAVIATVTGAP